MRHLRHCFSAPSPSPASRAVRSKRIVVLSCLSMVFVAGLLSPPTATAQENISEITVIYGGHSGIQPPAGYTKVNIDLNQGAGGDFIYFCYKKGVGAPITGLAITLNNGLPPADAVYTLVPVDLNRNAGGDFVWLWYTKDPACSTVHNINVQTAWGPPPEGYTIIPIDLNEDAGGAYIYLSYEEY